jgi:hypothetical protein
VVPETVSPAVYDWASVIVVFGNERLVRPAQVAADAEGATRMEQARRVDERIKTPVADLMTNFS